MKHEFQKNLSLKVISSGILELKFECGVHRTVDLTPIMFGTLFGELKNPEFLSR